MSWPSFPGLAEAPIMATLRGLKSASRLLIDFIFPP
jgi:hypothetical protein